MDLIYPFEWCLPMIPFLNSNPKNPNHAGMQLINHMQSIIIGVHKDSYDAIKYQIAEEPENLQRLIVIDVSHDKNLLGNQLEIKTPMNKGTDSIRGTQMMDASQYSTGSSMMKSSYSNQSVKEQYSQRCGFLGLPELSVDDIPHNTQVSMNSSNQQSIRDSDLAFNTFSDSQSSVSIFEEGKYLEDIDQSELIKKVWEFDADKVMLPSKLKKELKK